MANGWVRFLILTIVSRRERLSESARRFVRAPGSLSVRLGIAVHEERARLGFRSALPFFRAISFYLLGRQFRDVRLLAQKAIAFSLRDDDVADCRKSRNQSAPDIAPDLRN